MKAKTRNLNLPLFFKPLFWSYKFPLMDPQKNKKRIIIDTINYGGVEALGLDN